MSIIFKGSEVPVEWNLGRTPFHCLFVLPRLQFKDLSLFENSDHSLMNCVSAKQNHKFFISLLLLFSVVYPVTRINKWESSTGITVVLHAFRSELFPSCVLDHLPGPLFRVCDMSYLRTDSSGRPSISSRTPTRGPN
jgi:hypothetical protein